MGVCGSSSKPVRPQVRRTSQLNDSSSNMLHYDRRTVLRIHGVDDNRRPIEDRISVALTEPKLAFCLQYPAGARRFWCSGCVIPGLDPRGGFKACQDMVFVESYEGIMLIGEFDGHGAEGEPVVAFCKRFALPFLKANTMLARTDPSQFLVNLNEECDKSLKKAVDCKGSGCTAVMMLYVDGRIAFSCVGDSRAILATTAPHMGYTAPPRREDKELLEEIKNKRFVAPEMVLTAEQLTQDQKPEDPVELKRITKAGGLVMRLEDEFGRKVGPYRVWKVEGMYPGIAMSRSLGDVIAQEIGVISTPVVTSHVESTDHDYFIVLASDGVWDVMENQEVCDFVEAFRNKSQRDLSEPKQVEIVQPGSVTIAQLLCEEARARWLSIVEAEDVLIDDISCVIVELQVTNERKRAAPRRTTGPTTRNETEDVPGLESSIRRTKTRMRDPRRNSTNPVEDFDTTEAPKPKPKVKDPRRSSISSFQPLDLGSH